MIHIFLHGLGQGPDSWGGVLAALPEQGECPDLTSFFSKGEAAYQDLYRGFCAYCAEKTQPLGLCGLSLGAVLALHYALDHPERVEALVLIAPQYKVPKGLLKVQNVLFRLMPDWAFAETGLGKGDMISLTNSMLELDFTPRLGELRCPTLVLCGEKDKTNAKAARELARLAPAARFQAIPGVGHEVNRDAPEALAAAWTDFMKNCSKQKRRIT